MQIERATAGADPAPQFTILNLQFSIYNLSSYLLAAFLLLASSGSSLAEPPFPKSVRVSGVEITAADVNDNLQAALHESASRGAMDDSNRFTMLDRLIERELVLGALAKNGHRAKPAAVDEALAQLKTQLANDESLYRRHLEQKSLTEKVLRGQLEWKLSWESYLKATLTDQVLETYFKAHQADFDGRELRVSQVLWQVPKESTGSSSTEELKAKAAQLRAEILAGKLTFADAAKKHSASPSGKDGGDQGFIPRHDVMGEDFSRAAFALKKGEISQPLETAFGVHLIQVTDVRPGKKSWSDVRKELRNAAAQDLFRKIVETERPRATIQGLVPPTAPKFPTAKP